MTGAFRVDQAELLEAIDRLHRFEQRVEQAMTDADHEVQRLHASWAGVAAEAHREAHETWRRGCADMHAALTVMRKVASTAHGNYSAAASANAAMWAV